MSDESINKCFIREISRWCLQNNISTTTNFLYNAYDQGEIQLQNIKNAKKY